MVPGIITNLPLTFFSKRLLIKSGTAVCSLLVLGEAIDPYSKKFLSVYRRMTLHWTRHNVNGASKQPIGLAMIPPTDLKPWSKKLAGLLAMKRPQNESQLRSLIVYPATSVP